MTHEANSKAKNALRQYLSGDARLMQLATVDDDQPWICTVYFVADEELNLYWLSLPTRRHSQELSKHNKVAVAIAIKVDQPIIGVQAEGRAHEVADQATVDAVMRKYMEKYKMGRDFAASFAAGTNQHRLFCLKPSLFVLMDEVNFKQNGRMEWRI